MLMISMPLMSGFSTTCAEVDVDVAVARDVERLHRPDAVAHVRHDVVVVEHRRAVDRHVEDALAGAARCPSTG